jgi:hypothetical protein
LGAVPDPKAALSSGTRLRRIFARTPGRALLALMLAASASVMLQGARAAPLAVTFTVTTTADSGPGSLRQAILDANATPDADAITFNIAGSGVKTISPASGLPTISQPVTIDGWTQGGPGYAGPPLIELNGTSAGAANGLVVLAGMSTVRGLVINRF